MNTPAIEPDMEKQLDLTCPVIIMRCGGLDGVAMQESEYSAMLNDLNMNVHVVTGREEKAYSSVEVEGREPTVVSRLDFFHPDSQLLFANEFTAGAETEGVRKIDEKEWRRVFEVHKNTIRDEIDKVLCDTPNNTPVIVFNLLSLRHAQPAAAVAIRELMEKYPDRGFISHAADPDAERPEKISRIKDFVLKYISANRPSEPYSGGPYNLDNLYHVVLNPKQKEHFLYKYRIPAEHVFEIPDFLEFGSEEAVIPSEPDEGFVEYLGENCVAADGDSYRYWKVPIDSESVFFLSPVRPVYRKRIKEAMLIAYQYCLTRNKPVVFVVTHPNVDDTHYFLETMKFANAMGVQYVHLGENFTMQKLDYVYRNMAALPTVGVVASSAGGWENALNEMAHACIPFFMSISLNSFKPITEEIGIQTYGMDFSGLHELINGSLASELSGIDLSGIASMGKQLEWIDAAFDDDKRKKLIEHNYRQAYRNLSHHATALRFMEVILTIYERHGLPGMPGQPCVL